MQTLTHNKEAADLYRLAFLLTGRSGLSVDVAVEALEIAEGNGPFFANWMLGWARRLVIAKALAASRQELADSAQRLAGRMDGRVLPAGWRLEEQAGMAELQGALLEIEMFPRCALLLTVFEGMSAVDAATLLDCDRETVVAARNFGLRELTRNLAMGQGWSCDLEVQHA